MKVGDGDWRPTGTHAMLEQRARLLARTRRFFADRNVLEVDTPTVVNSPVTDVHIQSARVDLTDGQPGAKPYFLHTSPEYAMKRLLAAGSGDIYQICHVVRGFERGRLHNPEFTLVEWYRIGFSLDQLMSEVDGLVRDLVGARANTWGSERVSYQEAFARELQLDPFTARVDELAQAAGKLGWRPPAAASAPAGPTRPTVAGAPDHRDELLEFLMGTCVGPRLGRDRLTFIHGYPATQAALARIDPGDSRAALRFELYCQGIELANGFHELAGASEQRSRFARDIAERRRLGLPTYEPDERLLSGLESGMPDCAGVAVGFDRVAMLATGAATIDEVLAFPTERA
jgi:elongation factor P--(R)-beta-lysine ligase